MQQISKSGFSMEMGSSSTGVCRYFGVHLPMEPLPAFQAYAGNTGTHMSIATALGPWHSKLKSKQSFERHLNMTDRLALSFCLQEFVGNCHQRVAVVDLSIGDAHDRNTQIDASPLNCPIIGSAVHNCALLDVLACQNTGLA